MAKNPKLNPNSIENKMKIKQKRKRSKSEDEQLATEDPLQIQDEEEEALEIDTNDNKIINKNESGVMSELTFDSLNLSELTLKAINDMEFNDTTQV